MASPRSGRPRDTDVDEKIVVATRAILYEGGLDALSIMAVAQRAGVGRPAVYRRYPDRDALALAVLFHDLAAAVADHADKVPEDQPLLDQLVAVTTPLFAYYTERPEVSAALLQLAVFSPQSERQRIDLQLFGFLGDLSGRMTRARDRGELGPDADLGSLTFAFFALYFMTALGGVKGVLPGVETQVAVFRAMLAQQIAGASALGERTPMTSSGS